MAKIIAQEHETLLVDPQNLSAELNEAENRKLKGINKKTRLMMQRKTLITFNSRSRVPTTISAYIARKQRLR